MSKVARISKPEGKRELVTKFQTANQIVKQMQRAEFNSRETSKKLAPFFKSKDPVLTCKKVWYFLKTHVRYTAEPGNDQTAKTISRFIVDGVGDCKHYSTTSVGILNACGIPSWFVLVSQNKFRRSPNHAYCEALVNGQVVVIDPCKNVFNQECEHYYKYRKAPRKK